MSVESRPPEIEPAGHHAEMKPIELVEYADDRSPDPAIVVWLVDTGYGTDYTLTGPPIPEPYRWPLAHEYSRRTLVEGNLHPDESPEHWYALLALALQWNEQKPNEFVPLECRDPR